MIQTLSSNQTNLVKIVIVSCLFSIGIGIGIVHFFNIFLTTQNVFLGMFILSILIGIVPALYAYYRDRDAFNPQVLVPIFATISLLSPYILSNIPGTIAGPSVLIALLPKHLTNYFFAILLGLIGLNLGLIIKFHPNISPNKAFPTQGIQYAYRIIMLAGIAILWISILLHGPEQFLVGEYTAAGTKGQNRVYNLGFTLLIAFNLISMPILYAYAYLCIHRKRIDIWLIFFISVTILPLTIRGIRGPLVSLIMVVLIMFNVCVRRIKLSELIYAGQSLLIFMGFMTFFRQNRSFQTVIEWLERLVETPVFLIADGLRSLAPAGYPLLGALEWIPTLLPWQNGTTFLASILNLVPSFVYGSTFNRPILLPTQLFATTLFTGSNHGFGLGIITEAYMNWGLWGITPVMFVVGMLLSYSYAKLKTQSYNTIIFYSYVIWQTFYLFRDDSNRYVKSLFYAALALFICEILGQSFDRLSRRQHSK